MTDDDRTLDELASAHLDGQTTADEAHRIEHDPDLQARVEAMRAVRKAIRAAMPPSAPEQREQAIAAALRAYDTAADGAGVTSIAAARSARRRVEPRRLVGVAAAILLLAIAVPVVAELAGGGGDQDEMATSAGDSAQSEAAGRSTDEASAGAGTDAAEETAGQAGAPIPTMAGGLGSFATVDALEEAVRAVLLQPAAHSEAELDDLDAADDGAGSCAEQARAAAASGTSLALAASAILEDRPVEVFVLAEPDGERTMTVADPARACEALESRALGG